MQIIQINKSTRPPEIIYETAQKMFGVDFNKGATFTVGNTIHSKEFPISDDLLEHEQVHVIQQTNYDGGWQAWWDRYFEDPYFRYVQELEAYQKQYKYYCSKHKDRNDRAKFLHIISTHLTTIYGLQAIGLSLKQAKDRIQLK